MAPHIHRLIREYGRIVADLRDNVIAARRTTTDNEALGALAIADNLAKQLPPLFEAIRACVRLEECDARSSTDHARVIANASCLGADPFAGERPSAYREA